jgi:hypothetical protein
MDNLDQLLIEFGDLSESVLMSLELTNFFRDVRLVFDRVIDPRTGVLIEDLARRVVQIDLEHSQTIQIRNDLGNEMWGSEANWGLNEILEATISKEDSAEHLRLRWSGETRNMEFRFRSGHGTLLGATEAERALRQFWGDDHWR